MRVEYLIISIIVVLVVLFALITFAGKVFPSLGQAVKDFLAGIGK